MIHRMSSPAVAPLPSAAGREIVRLRCSFQAPSGSLASALAQDARARSAEVFAVRPSPAGGTSGCDWMVTLNAPPLPLTVDALRAWEREMLAVEHARPGCRFLGWSVLPGDGSFAGPVGRSDEHESRRRCPRRSQRELVTASLLRCPPVERGGVVHGRAA
jgi:hypothetical protein